jgi:hypothetical protein
VIEKDDDFTVINPKHKFRKTNATATISEGAISTALPSTPIPETQVSGNSPHKNQFLTAPREKIPPVVIHRHFQGGMTRLNKDFHRIFTVPTYRIHNLQDKSWHCLPDFNLSGLHKPAKCPETK